MFYKVVKCDVVVKSTNDQEFLFKISYGHQFQTSNEFKIYL